MRKLCDHVLRKSGDIYSYPARSDWSLVWCARCGAHRVTASDGVGPWRRPKRDLDVENLRALKKELKALRHVADIAVLFTERFDCAVVESLTEALAEVPKRPEEDP